MCMWWLIKYRLMTPLLLIEILFWQLNLRIFFLYTNEVLSLGSCNQHLHHMWLQLLPKAGRIQTSLKILWYPINSFIDSITLHWLKEA